jgi:HAE1 family hydrophobic/amphiphilic exporter-1
VINVVQQQSQQVTAGQIGAPPAPADQAFQYTVNVEGRLADPAEFGNIVVKVDSSNGGQITRVKDVGRVELGAQTYSQVSQLNNRPSAGVAIFQLPNANALDVAHRVDARMKELAKAFPQGLTYTIPFDTTIFVQTSIHEVYKTLFEAAILVLIVILVFLQDWRAMLVPATTVPVTIIGAFAAMWALGFTVNLSTLFAIILAIGIVVDDAIVIVEGVAHHMERGMTSHDASIKAMDELFGPIIGITLVLMSVFIPAAFLPGLTGQMYAQFALVIAATAIISAVNAATLKPTQCALWLRAPTPPEKRNFFYRGFNRVYGKMEDGYAWVISHMTHHAVLAVVVGLVAGGVGVWGVAQLPTAFIPPEDQGYVMISVQLPDGAALGRTKAVLEKVTNIARATPGVDQVVAISGISVLDNSATLQNAGVAYVILKDWSQRSKAAGTDLLSLYLRLSAELDKMPEAIGLVLIPPPIQGIGNASGFTMQVELRDGSFDYAKLQALARTIVNNGNSQSGLQRLSTTFRASVPQLEVIVDRVKAETLNVSVGDVFNVLSGYIGSAYVNQFNKFGRTYQVYVQADSKYRLEQSDIEHLWVRSKNNNMVPLGTLVQIKHDVGPSLVSLYNLYPTATINGGAAQGFSSGQALSLMEQDADHTLPRGAGYDWTAMSYQEKVTGNQIIYAFGFGLLLVYLCLAGQYESWIAPLAVILAVPLSLLGPYIALGSLGVANNLYTQIGLVLLIALSAKNAILIVEVARERRAEGEPILDAALDAARTRFRPILMTSFAFILGVLPLVTATGAGANSRISLGLSVFSGMIASTCLAVLFVPSFFVVLQRFEERRKPRKEAQPASTPA